MSTKPPHWLGNLSEKEIVEKTHNDPAILRGYYDTLVEEYGFVPVISPVKNPDWVKEAARWLAEGEIVCEAGCGDGTFAESVLDVRDSKIKTYYLVDFATDVIRTAAARLRFKRSKMPDPKPEVILKPWNIEALSRHIEKNCLDRVIAINVFGDTRLEIALKQVFKVLKPGGFLRATFYSKETFDEFWAEIRAKGYFVNDDWAVWLTPLGFYKGKISGYALNVVEDSKVKLPDFRFARIQRYATLDQWLRLLEKIGFRVSSTGAKRVYYPYKVVEEGWGKNLTPYQRRLIKEKWNGSFPEIWDIVMQKPESRIRNLLKSHRLVKHSKP